MTAGEPSPSVPVTVAGDGAAGPPAASTPGGRRDRRRAPAVAGVVVLLAGLAAAPAPAGGPPSAPNGHVDVVSPSVPAPPHADVPVAADVETEPVGAGGDAAPARPGSAFPRGAFSCQDHVNGPPGNTGDQNLELVCLEKVLDLP